jgi:Putative zinc-finger
MNHRYIDEHSVAERYLEHALPPAEHDAFEAHMVQCDECSDRLMLAQIFLDHKAIGIAREAPSAPQSVAETSQPPAAADSAPTTSPQPTSTQQPAAANNIPEAGADSASTNTAAKTPPAERVWPKRAYFVAQFTPWQLFFLAVGAAAWLLAVPTAYFLGQLVRLSGRH